MSRRIDPVARVSDAFADLKAEEQEVLLRVLQSLHNQKLRAIARDTAAAKAAQSPAQVQDTIRLREPQPEADNGLCPHNVAAGNCAVCVARSLPQ